MCEACGPITQNWNDGDDISECNQHTMCGSGNGLVGHNATGINVLYEDGRVRFLQLPALERMPDHPLLNHRGEVEAGVSVDDATLAPSWRPPFVNVLQR